VAPDVIGNKMSGQNFFIKCLFNLGKENRKEKKHNQIAIHSGGLI
jgi:hypothetical protein